MLILPFVGPTDYFVQAAEGQRTWSVSDLLSDLAVILTTMLVFGCLVAGAAPIRRLLRARMLAFCGVMSYSVFLLHTTVIRLLGEFQLASEDAEQALFGSTWATFGAFLLATMLVSGGLGYLSYRFIESPFMRRKPA